MNMNELKIQSFIEKLITETKNNNLTWSRFTELSLNPILINFLGSKIKEINKIDSFVCNYKSGFIILTKRGVVSEEWWNTIDVYEIIIQSNEYAKPSYLFDYENFEHFQADLIRISYLIEESISRTNLFIDNFLDEEFV